MSTIYTHQSENVAKTWIMMSVFLCFVVAVGFVFSQVMQSSAILYGAIIFALVMNVGSYWYSDKLVLMMSGAKPVEKKDAPELYRIVENLAITAGLPTPRVFIIESQAPNAFATGRDAKHAVVAVTTGILARLDKQELEGVLAHELSHIGNKDMLVSTVAVVLAGFIAMLSDFFIRWTWFGGGRSSDRGDNRLQGILIIVGIVLAILAPIAASLMQLAISRKRESLADASGALLTRNPGALADALLKISQDPRPLQTANNVTAHLFIVNPFKGKDATKFLAKMFMTHPSIEERVKALREMDTSGR